MAASRFWMGCLVVATGVGAIAGQPAGDAREVGVAPALQAALEEWAAVPGHYGVSASVILADGAQWAGAAGRAGDEVLAPDHLIQIASITKTMTAALALQLVDEGVVQLGDPLDRWLPPIANVAGTITIRQLLNHTNGLANYTASPALRPAIQADGSRVFTPQELLAFIGPPVAPPGGKTQYTNTAFLLLGLVVESATGRSIVDLYRQRLWAPLDLQEIFLPGFQDPPRPVAPAFGPDGLVQPMESMAVLSVGHAAFGLLASARDVARWGRALFMGQIVSPAMQTAMRDLVPAAGNIPGETGAGLGIRGYRFADRQQFGHSGGANYGSSLLLFDPETSVTVVVIMNQGGGAHHFELAPRLLQIAS